VESFRAHQETARRVLQAARASWPRGSHQADLAGLIGSKLVQIRRIMRAARELGQRARQRKLPHGICHADIHGANILAGPDGRLFVIDWDGMLLAPPERDLIFWHNAPEWPEIAAAYGLAGELDRELIAYYGHEWVVQEIADFGENVFFLPLAEEQKADSLDEFRRLFEPGNVVAQVLGV
jgi:spectinomycin phosphotransferase